MKGIVLAGCGPTDEKNRELGRLLAEATGADLVVRARTGGRPDGLPDALGAMDELRESGARRALVVSTHLVAGELHRQLDRVVLRSAPLFDELALADPLIASEKDAYALAAALDEALPARPGRAVVLAGHRGDAASLAWLALERAFGLRGRSDVLVGAPDSVARRVAEEGLREVLLAPLLMELGFHARRDVLGRLRGRIEAAGTAVEPWPHALSELPAVRELLVAHALAAPALF